MSRTFILSYLFEQALGSKSFHTTTNYLRSVPTIVIAHTFCASSDTRVSYR